MKCVFLLAALAVMFGLSAGLSLRSNDLLQRLNVRKMGGGGKGGDGDRPGPDASGSGDGGDGDRRKGGKGGKGGKDSSDGDSGDEDDKKQEYLEFSAMLAYSSLASKCEVAALYIGAAANEAGMTFEEVWNASAVAIPTLAKACPDVKDFLDYYEMVDEEGKGMMVKGMAPYGLLMQCANLFADIDTMKLLGFTDTSDDGTPESRVMVHGKPLFEGCMEIFGAAEKEGDEVGDDLKKVEETATEEKRYTQLRSLLKQLEEALRR